MALKARYLEMNRLPKEAVDVKKALAVLPALIKGYLRLNCYVGMGAVIDADFNTTDVSIVAKTAHLPRKYLDPYRNDILSQA